MRASGTVKDIVKSGFCSGCGVCAGVCSNGALSIGFNEVGEYVPRLKADLCSECGICLRVCPFSDDNPDEDEHGKVRFSSRDGMGHCHELGYGLDAYVGYAPDGSIRWEGTSGGMLTWTLCYLLEQEIVDHVVCVEPSPDSDCLNRFAVVSTPDEVRGCSKSSYYPVELSGVVRHIMDHDARYAVVGLPCVCKAMRNAQFIFPKLQNRITYLFGLVCAGQQVNTRFSNEVARLAGLEERLVFIRSRIKKLGVPPGNYLFLVRGEQGKECEASFFGGVKDVWAGGAFRVSGCNYCDDVFAECADAVFMDAWLPEYMDDSAGHNIVLNRDSALSDIFKAVISLKRIGFERVAGCQAVNPKREALQARLYLRRLALRPSPIKRVRMRVPSARILVKVFVMNLRQRAARKNLRVGKAYDAFRMELLPELLIQGGTRWMRRVKKLAK